MSGKITFKNGLHSSRIGELMAPLSLAECDWHRFEKIIRRSLTSKEREDISEGLENLRHIAQVLNSDKVSAQDVKKTLLAIGGTKGSDQAKQAVKNCDAKSRALIDGALYEMGERTDFEDCPPSAFRAAALLAANGFKGVNGAPAASSRLRVYAFARTIWAALGRNDMAMWEIDGEATPLVKFATALLAQIEDSPPGYSVVAKGLRRVSA
jgi:hypothetical protein